MNQPPKRDRKCGRRRPDTTKTSWILWITCSSILLLWCDCSLVQVVKASFLPTSRQCERRQCASFLKHPHHLRRSKQQEPLFSKDRHHHKDAANSNHNDKTSNAIRLNKVFKATHSRREADALIASGRVSVNGQDVTNKGGFKVVPFLDKISLDGKVIHGWEAMNGISRESLMNNFEKSNDKTHRPSKNSIRSKKNSNKNQDKSQSISTQNFEYIKYWKPRGVTCTTDPKIRSNIISHLLQHCGYRPRHRVYPVGRLDRDTSGLIVLTSDGRLPNAALRGQFKQPKVYQVWVDRPLRDGDLQQLRDGVVITTVAQRDGNRGKPLTAPTLPCQVERIRGNRGKNNAVQMTLVEGRNRQIRKMMQALGYEVIKLHRIKFMGLTLRPLQGEGDWAELSPKEMTMVEDVLQRAASSARL